MADDSERMCVLLPLARDLRWLVPQACLAELVTVNETAGVVPASIDWRGRAVPVVDFGSAGELPWIDPKSGNGLIAVFLGLREQRLDYWGVALRGEGLGIRRLDLAACSERDSGGEFLLVRCELDGLDYVLPDLPAVQAFAGEQAGLAIA